MENVIIIGGGHVGSTLAVDMFLRRNETNLDPHLVLMHYGNHLFLQNSGKKSFRCENIMTGEVNETIFPSQNVHAINHDIRYLMQSAVAVIVTVPDIPLLRKMLIEYLEACPINPGATITFVRAGQGGQLCLMDKWRKSSRLNKLHLLMVEDSFYGTRCIDNIIEFKRKNVTRVATLSEKPDEAMNCVIQLFSGPSVPDNQHQFEQVRPLDLQFDPLGYIIHLAVALDKTNLTKTASGTQYLHYSDGVHEENAGLIDALDHERVALARSYGAETRLFTTMLTEQYGLPQQPTFLEMAKSTKSIYRSLSEKSLNSLKTGRMIQEDYPGLLTMGWFAEISGENFMVTRDYVNQITQMLQALKVNTDGLDYYHNYLNALNLNKSDLVGMLSN
ncbi:NAD/NADP octopine/nopaline dehydrogenase family protein [Enterobacter ludwigii]|uniref:NAD/NADP octopine/nopaline dehydrogenase family protein n=2 Tax=Enterobacteriaceae TaxID=543 RepID=UPI003CF3AE8E